MVDPKELNNLAKLVYSLVEFQNGITHDTDKISQNYKAQLADLKKQIQAHNKTRSYRTRSTAKPCPSTSLVKDDSEGSNTTGRPKRKAALKAMEVPKSLAKKKYTKRTKKRKSSIPVQEPHSQTPDKQEAALDATPKIQKKMIMDCSVVLKKMDIEVIPITSTTTQKTVLEVLAHNEESKPSCSKTDMPIESEESKSPSDALRSKSNNLIANENGKSDSDVGSNSGSETIHTLVPTNEDQKDNYKEVLSGKSRRSSRLLKTITIPEVDIIEASVVESVKLLKDKELISKPIEVLLQKSSMQVKSNETKVLHVSLKRQLPEESPSSSSEENQPAPKLKMVKVSIEERIVQAEPVVGRVTPKRITRSKMVNKDVAPAGDNKTPDETSTEVVIASPEKRVTRSKMAKPKEKVVINCSESSDDEESALPKITPLPTVKMMARVKELREFYTPSNPAQEKENCFSRGLKTADKKNCKISPLQNRNAFVTPASKLKNPSTILLSGTKPKTNMDEVERRRKEEEAIKKRAKEQEAIRKKHELLKAKQEDIRRKNEEKMIKVAAIREANTKETNERLVKMEKEKEERDRITKELIEKKKEEGTTKKRIMHETKAFEAEARRLKEEAARLARIKEIEEEKRKEEELRIKRQEEMERLKKQRLEEQRMKEAALMKTKELQKKRAIIPLKDKDNYDINDIEPNDSEDDDENMRNPKKEIPMWARKGEDRFRQEAIQSFVPLEVVAKYFCCPSQSPDLKEFFGKMTMKRVRTSSAVWLDTPPLKTKP